MGRAATTRDSKGARGASLAGSPVATRAKSCMVCQPDPRFTTWHISCSSCSKVPMRPHSHVSGLPLERGAVQRGFCEEKSGRVS